MKNIQKTIWLSAVTTVIFAMLALPLPAIAQAGDNSEEAEAFSQEQLAQLLAPIALYPDELIAQVLLASTYPLEIVMADRWVQQHKGLQGNDLADALEGETWDPSVKALVNFPTVLAMLSQKLDLTTKLGDAFLEQEEDVMEMVQELRKRAADAGNLKSTREQKVLIDEDKIIIEPADTRVIYVPIYDPYLVYGPWWYPAYPPYYFYTAPYPGVVFSFGIGVTLGLPWGYAWGGWDWYNHSVLINVNRNIRYNRYIDRSRYIQRYERRGEPIRSGVVSWQHDPDHRRGVAYKGKVTARKFGQLPAHRGEARPESRGFISPSRSGGDTRGVGVGPDRARRVTVPSGVPERKVRKDNKSGARVTPPIVPRESVFSGGDNNATRVRRSSERGSQSVGGANVYRRDNAAQPRRGYGIGGSTGGGGNRGGDSDPFGGRRRR
ncbi:MAG: DUF3300 domain-containing protein [Desulfuromonadaceae bacterium]|nr:DUF3300 domain-containing protein [Desulfuromonadaceae bacterium]